MAVRSVVANKSEPMKAGNSLEGKTWMSMRARKKKITQSHNLLPLQKREDRGKGNVLRQRL
jgi:hypothetical protein